MRPKEAVEQCSTLIDALRKVDHGMVGDGGGPTLDQESGADAMRDVCIAVAALWEVELDERGQHEAERPARATLDGWLLMVGESYSDLDLADAFDEVTGSPMRSDGKPLDDGARITLDQFLNILRKHFS